jgi:hypothetical protein
VPSPALALASAVLRIRANQRDFDKSVIRALATIDALRRLKHDPFVIGASPRFGDFTSAKLNLVAWSARAAKDKHCHAPVPYRCRDITRAINRLRLDNAVAVYCHAYASTLDTRPPCLA